MTAQGYPTVSCTKKREFVSCHQSESQMQSWGLHLACQISRCFRSLAWRSIAGMEGRPPALESSSEKPPKMLWITSSKQPPNIPNPSPHHCGNTSVYCLSPVYGLLSRRPEQTKTLTNTPSLYRRGNQRSESQRCLTKAAWRENSTETLFDTGLGGWGGSVCLPAAMVTFTCQFDKASGMPRQLVRHYFWGCL